MSAGQVNHTNGVEPTLSQRVLQARLMRPALTAEGRRRQREAGSKDKASQDRHRTREVLGRFCGLSGRSFDKALAIIDAAENDPERYAGVIDQLDRTGNIERAFHAVVFAEMRRDRIQAPPIFSETKIGARRLGYFTARELGWLIGFFAELGKHFDPAAGGYACDVFTEAQVRCAVRRAEGPGKLPPKVFAKSKAKRGARNAR